MSVCIYTHQLTRPCAHPWTLTTPARVLFCFFGEEKKGGRMGDWDNVRSHEERNARWIISLLCWPIQPDNALQLLHSHVKALAVVATSESIEHVCA